MKRVGAKIPIAVAGRIIAATARASRCSEKDLPGFIGQARDKLSSAASTNHQTGLKHLPELRGVGESSEDRNFRQQDR
jgi:hypothetical protein